MLVWKRWRLVGGDGVEFSEDGGDGVVCGGEDPG